MEKEREAFARSGFGRWSWFAMIEKLMKGDITKQEEVCDMNLIACLNLLSYWKERDEQIKQMEENNKIKK